MRTGRLFGREEDTEASTRSYDVAKMSDGILRTLQHKFLCREVHKAKSVVACDQVATDIQECHLVQLVIVPSANCGYKGFVAQIMSQCKQK